MMKKEYPQRGREREPGEVEAGTATAGNGVFRAGVFF